MRAAARRVLGRAAAGSGSQQRRFSTSEAVGSGERLSVVAALALATQRRPEEAKSAGSPAVASSVLSGGDSANRYAVAGHCSQWSRRDRAKLGYALHRSSRGRALVSDFQVKQIGQLINDLVDLDCWDEDQEQELFEHAVAQCMEKIAPALPAPFYDMIHADVSHLGDEAILSLSKSLIKLCCEECNLPWLDEQDSRRIIRCVVEVLMQSMRERQTLTRYLDLVSNDETARNAVVLEVFIKGAMDVFFDDDLRRHLVQDVSTTLPEVPVVPVRLCERIAEHIIKLFGGLLQDCLKEAYLEYRTACLEISQLPLLVDALQDCPHEREKVLHTYQGRPFLIQLRRCIVREMMDEASPWPLQMQAMEARLLGWVVDVMFQCLPGLDKIEQTVQPFHRDLLGE